MQIHTSINIESFLNNVNIYILFEVRALILFMSIYSLKNEQILLEHRPDVLRSGLVIQVFRGESEEKTV